MDQRVCACGSSKEVRKKRNRNLWLCEACHKTWKEEPIRYKSYGEACDAYEDHLQHSRTGKNWPKEFKKIWDKFVRRDQTMTRIADNFGLSIHQILLWYNRCRDILPGQLSSQTRNSLRCHKAQVAAAIKEFTNDKLWVEFRREAESRGLSLKFIPKYEHGRFVGYRHGQAKVQGGATEPRIVHLYKTAVISGKLRSGGYWSSGVRIVQIQKERKQRVIVIEVPDRCFFIIPVREIPEHFFQRKEIIINIPVKGWNVGSGRRHLVDWLIYKDNWNEFACPLKKKMAKASLTQENKEIKGSIA